jgi:predicted DNA-binding transcriptional regulator AlpA
MPMSIVQEAETRPKRRQRRQQFLLAAIAPPPDPVRFLNKAEVVAIVRATYPSIHEWMRRGTFPLPRVLSGQVGSRQTVIAWLEEDIVAWARSRPKRVPGMLGGVGRKK